MIKEYAVIIGLSGPNALSLIRSLGREKIPLIGIQIGNSFNTGKYSRYIENKNIFCTNTYEGAIKTLLDIAHKYKLHESKAVIFLPDEDTQPLLYENYELLSKYYHLPISNRVNPSELLDKEKNVSLAKGTGVLIPKSTRLSSYKPLDVKEVVTKPVNCLAGSKKDIRLISTEELNNKLDNIKDEYSETDLIIQEYIGSKNNTDLISVNAYLTKSKEIVVSGMYRRLHAKYGENAKNLRIYSTSYKSFWDNKVEEISKDIVRNINWPYPLNIDLIWNKEKGKYYVHEINLRQGAEHYGQTIAGRNLPAIVFADKTDNSSLLNKLVERKYKIKHNYTYENRELTYLLKEIDGSILKNLKELYSQPLYLCYFDLRDIYPSLVQMIQEIRYYKAK